MQNRDYDVVRRYESQHPRAGTAIRVVTAATDFTATANLAVHRAAELCRAARAQLHIVHVMGGLRPAFGARRVTGATAVSHLRQLAARLATDFGVLAETHLGSGNAAREIAAYATASGSELVVVGNSRKSLLAEILGINMALRIQRRTGLPVLAVSNPVLQSYASVLLASDLSPEAARAGNQALKLFPHTKFFVLHAFESPYTGMLNMASVSRDVIEDYQRKAKNEGMERLRKFAYDAYLDRRAELCVHLGHPAIAARARVAESDIDLIVLRPTKRWLTSGVTEHLIADPPCDLLLMP